MLPAQERDPAVPAASVRLSAETVLRPILTAHPGGARRSGIGSHYERIIDLVPVAICLCDRDGRVTFRNLRAGELWRGSSADGGSTSDWFVAVGADGVLLPVTATPLGAALREGISCREV